MKKLLILPYLFLAFMAFTSLDYIVRSFTKPEDWILMLLPSSVSWLILFILVTLLIVIHKIKQGSLKR